MRVDLALNLPQSVDELSALVSSNLREWNPVSFRFDNEERDAPARESFAATDVSLAHIEMADVIPAGAFKLKVE